MTLFGLPMWVYLVVNTAAGISYFLWKRLGLGLRANHRLTCRVYYQLLFILDFTMTSSSLCFWWLIAARWFAWTIIGMGTIAEGGAAVEWARGHLVPPKQPWESPWGRVMWPRFFTTVEHACEAWRHRKHDDAPLSTAADLPLCA